MMPRDPQVRRHTSPSLYPSSNPSVHFFASLQPSTVDGRTLFKLRAKLHIILYLCNLYTLFLVWCPNFFVAAHDWALGAMNGPWGSVADGDSYRYYIMCGRGASNAWAGAMILIFFNRKNQSVFCLFYGFIVILHVTIS